MGITGEAEAHERSRPPSVPCPWSGPDAPAPPALCASPFEGRNGVRQPIRQRPSTPSEEQPRRPPAPDASNRPASETDRAPPIPIAGVPFRSTRLFHASRDRAPSSFLHGGATREKALFIVSRGRGHGRGGRRQRGLMLSIRMACQDTLHGRIMKFPSS